MSNTENDTDRFDALLRHVVQAAPMPSPPADFAQMMAQRVRDQPEEARMETWLTRAILVIAALAVGAFSIPFITFVATRLQGLVGDAPWPLLLTVVAAFGGVKLLDLLPLRAQRVP